MAPDFERRHYIDGPALYFSSVQVAAARPVSSEPGALWRVSTNPQLAGRRYRFVEDESAARQYIEAWARKWEAEIRQAYRN